jgi:pimeloyl-ACP methyl ester carboxylesterase
MLRSIRTSTLEVAYEECGPSEGPAVILLHGFPDDPRAYDGAAPALAANGCRVLVPWLRGFGATRFLSSSAPRSGQQAALGQELLAFMTALAVQRPVLAGYDWGGRAACIVAALWPDLDFDDATFEHTAQSFDNPEFVEVVVHSYRHRHRAAAGDPQLEEIEQRLAAQPQIQVPTIALFGEESGLGAPAAEDRHAGHFSGAYERRVIARAGHLLPREAPDAVVAAVTDLLPKS